MNKNKLFSKANRRTNLGFTMIELLIVIVILAILTTIGLRSFSSSQIKSRDSRRKTDLQNITRALEVYYNDKGEYPISTGNAGIAGQAWGDPFVDPDNPTETLYMNVLPADPSDFNYYYTSPNGSYFQLYAYLENENDQALTKDADDAVMVYSGTDCVIGTCNYGIASTNTDPSAGHTLVIE
ncbi:MAG TPA: type II secretion system protein [Patescibacteria group bacterium]|jgi:general secretion pathway protein G